MFRNCKAFLTSFLVYSIAIKTGFGHGGEPHTPESSSSEVTTVQTFPSSDLALIQRLFISKKNQFNNGLLTVLVKEIDRPKTIIIPAKIIASPNGYAQIHVTRVAQVVVDDKFPIPNTGEKVVAHQVLAVVEPLLSVIELTDKKSELYKIESEIVVLKRDINRLTELGEFSPKKDLDNKKTELERAEKQRNQLLSTGLGKELIRSPISGIVSDNHLLPGQIVQPNETVLEIINPEQFRVEAYTFDYLQADQILSARLRSFEHPEKFYPLNLIGASPRIGEKDHSRHVLFSISEASKDLIIGMSVDVFLTTKETIRRVVIPQTALLKSGKSYSVFIFSGPELVLAHPVEVGLFFDQFVEIVSGLKVGDKIVSDTAILSKILISREEENHVH